MFTHVRLVTVAIALLLGATASRAEDWRVIELVERLEQYERAPWELDRYKQYRLEQLLPHIESHSRYAELRGRVEEVKRQHTLDLRRHPYGHPSPLASRLLVPLWMLWLLLVAAIAITVVRAPAETSASVATDAESCPRPPAPATTSDAPTVHIGASSPAATVVLSEGRPSHPRIRRSRTSPTPPGQIPSQAAFGRTLVLLGGFLGPQLLFGFFVGCTVNGDPMGRLIKLLPVLSGITLASACLVGLIFQRLAWIPVRPSLASSRATVGWSLCAATIAIAGSQIIGWAQDAFGEPLVEQELLVRALQGPDLALCVALVFVVPLAEELLFRRLMYGTLRVARGLGNMLAMVLTSAAFSAAHLNLTGFLVYAVIGAALALAYEKTGRLAIPVAIHALNNLLAVTMIGRS